MRSLALCSLLVIVACEPATVEVVNRAGPAGLTDVRWVRDDGKSSISIPGIIPPGGRSDPVSVRNQDLDREGRLRFQIVVRGARVELERTLKVKLQDGEANIVEVRLEDPVINASF